MKLTVEQVMEAIKDAGLEPREYSGRGMYGKHCLGVDVERNMMPEAFEICVNLIKNGAETEAIAEFGRGIDYDSMGLGMIIYWPALTLTGEQVIELMGDEADGEEAYD